MCHETWSTEPHALYENLYSWQELSDQVSVALPVLQAAHEVLLKHLKAVGDLNFLTHNEVAGQLGVLLEVW